MWICDIHIHTYKAQHIWVSAALIQMTQHSTKFSLSVRVQEKLKRMENVQAISSNTGYRSVHSNILKWIRQSQVSSYSCNCISYTPHLQRMSIFASLSKINKLPFGHCFFSWHIYVPKYDKSNDWKVLSSISLIIWVLLWYIFSGTTYMHELACTICFACLKFRPVFF
jgi:hypothetical protein